MDRNDLHAIAAAFVDALVDDPKLREEAANSFGGPDAVAVFARLVTDALKLTPPLSLAEVGPVEDAMAAIYEQLRLRQELPANIRKGHRHYSSARG